MPTLLGEITEKATKEGTTGKYIELRVLPAGRDFPLTIRDFDDLASVEDFRRGDVVEIEFTERVGNYRGREVTYRNLTSIRHAEASPEQAALEEAASSDGQEREEEEAPQQRSTLASAASTGGWREAYSQSREAVETQRASIEAQTALKEAWEAVREAMRLGAVRPEESQKVRRLLVEFTGIGLAAMREASRSTRGGRD